MAETPMRQVIGDPLAMNPLAQAPDRSLSLQGIRNPGQTGGNALWDDIDRTLGAMSGMSTALGAVLAAKKDDWVTEGKMAFMRGVTEDAIREEGNMYTMQGWQMLDAADKANRFFANAIGDMDAARSMSPEQYNDWVNSQRANYLDSVPDDPAVQKAYIAAFDDIGPRLVATHIEQHNNWNKENTYNAFRSGLGSGSYSNADASRAVSATTPLRLSDGVVRPTVQSFTDRDVDVLTRTMLGEAAGEGSTGLAAVAHVVMNRALDGNYGGRSIADVALAPKQFSTWNEGAGGNNPQRYSTDSAVYQNAREIALSVLSGRHVDPTGGATHYYSPRGMQALVSEGSQSNLLPRWLEAERAKSGGETVIGGHIFVGRANLPAWAPEVITDAAGNTPEIEIEPGSDPDPNAVAEVAGVRTDETPSPASTQVQEYIRGMNIPDADKAGMVAEEMVLQLRMGDDQLFHDAGGISILRELNAPASLINQVNNAYDAFQREKSNEYNEERIRWEHQLTVDVASGTKTQDEALAEIQERYDASMFDDAKASQLANQVLDAAVRAGQVQSIDPMLRARLENVYRGVQRGDMDAGFAQNMVESIGEHHGLSAAQIAGWVDQMWSIERQTYNAELTEVARASAQHARDQQIDADISLALATRHGLGNITGTYGYGPNAIDASQHVVNRVYELAGEGADLAYQEYLTSGEMTEQEAQAAVESTRNQQAHTIFKEHGIIDEQMANAMTGAAMQPIGRDGQLNPSTVEAFDQYMQLSNALGAQYTSNYLLTDEARDLFTMARQLYANDYDIESPLFAAHNRLSGNVQANADYSAIPVGTVSAITAQGIRDLERDHLWGGYTEDGSTNFAINNLDTWNSHVQNLANIYKQRRPHVPDTVLVEEAMEDVVKGSYVVGDNLIYTPPDRDLSTAMGLQAFDKSVPGKALSDYLHANLQPLAREFAESGSVADTGGLPLDFIEAYKERMERQNIDWGQLAQTAITGRPNWTNSTPVMNWEVVPPFYTEYDADSGNFLLYLWDEGSGSATLDFPPLVINARDAGQYYLSQYEAAPGPIDTGVNFFMGLGEQMRNPTGQSADTTMGGMAQ